MKILILSSGRAGSTSLYQGLVKGINNSLGCWEVFVNHPPYYINDKNSLRLHINNINNQSKHKVIIEKNLIFQPYTLYPSYTVNFYKNYIKNFDQVILLIRNNVQDLAESLAYSRHNDKWHFPYTNNFNFSKDFLEKQCNFALHYNYLLKNLAYLTNLPLIKYENLFSGNKEYIKNFLKNYNIKMDNINDLYEALNPKNRYRQI